MLAVRTIPTLLLKGTGLVKGTNFKDHRYLGDPINAVRIFNDKEVDELALLDIEATTAGTGPNFELLAEIASQAFMPLSYGGGLTSVEQVQRVLALGYEKAIINSEFFADPTIVRRTSEATGSSSCVVSIDAKRSRLGKVWTHSRAGSKRHKISPVEAALRAVEHGAGELIVCNIDHEGTDRGYDLDLVAAIANAVEVPVVASGGAGSIGDFVKARNAGASAAAAGNLFVFQGRLKAVLISYPEYLDLQQAYAASSATALA